ncbi:MAG: DNA-directed RNA polymerase subunit omega [Victivallaceae bacterium]|nr:DNA-directed RNA polymerase subunit omega [Victivallaceae bacterium]
MNNEYLSRARKVITDPQVLTIVASRRAKQLALGGRPMIKCDSKNFLDVALLEIAEGLLSYEFGTAGESAKEVTL